MSRRVLIITEGKKENTLFKCIINKYFSKNDKNIEIHVFGTDIYKLYKNAIEEYGSLEYVNIIQVIKEYAIKTNQNIDSLEGKFTDLYLVFDFDYHIRANNKNELLINMIEYFSDETDTEKGKLYINYPMFEAINDNIEENIYITKEESSKYKSICDSRAKIRDYACLNKIEWNSIIAKHYCAVKKFLGKCDCCKDRPSQKEILLKQISTLSQENKMLIINTSIFFLLDYYGSKFIDKVLDDNCEKID